MLVCILTGFDPEVFAHVHQFNETHTICLIVSPDGNFARAILEWPNRLVPFVVGPGKNTIQVTTADAEEFLPRPP